MRKAPASATSPKTSAANALALGHFGCPVVRRASRSQGSQTRWRRARSRGSPPHLRVAVSRAPARRTRRRLPHKHPRARCCSSRAAVARAERPLPSHSRRPSGRRAGSQEISIAPGCAKARSSEAVDHGFVNCARRARGVSPACPGRPPLPRRKSGSTSTRTLLEQYHPDRGGQDRKIQKYAAMLHVI